MSRFRYIENRSRINLGGTYGAREDAETYLDLLARSLYNPEVTTTLPEIFAEKRVDDVRASLTLVKRHFVIVEGRVAGRLELSDALNDDPSVIDKFPEGVTLGYNTCYFFNPDVVSRNQALAHRVIADLSIREAFRTQTQPEASPWLPVAPVDDPSRGWLMLEGAASGFSVHAEEAQTGWFPDFGIEEIAFQPVYAALSTE